MIRHGRSTTILLTFLLVLGAPASAAWADSGSGSTTADSTTEAKPAVDTSAETTSTTKPAEDTSTKPSTETEVPETEGPAPEPEEPDVEEPETPEVPKAPDCEDAPGSGGGSGGDGAAVCVPDAPGPGTSGSGDLPFTGPGDVLLAMVLAMLASTGGILFLMGATGREQLEGLSRRSMDSPSGWHLAYRDLRKQQLDGED